MEKPYLERTKVLSRYWIDYGFGSPKAIMVMYLMKLAVFFAGGGIVVATLTSHLNPLHPSAWFDQPIFYEKGILWTVLLECLGDRRLLGAAGRAHVADHRRMALLRPPGRDAQRRPGRTRCR